MELKSIYTSNIHVILNHKLTMKNKFNVYRYFRGNDLVLAINLAAGLSIFFFGVSMNCTILIFDLTILLV